MSHRHTSSAMKKFVSEIGVCELCGCKRNLELHHIIPVVCGGTEEDENNWIVLCSTCHRKLTPRGLLSKAGIEKSLSEVVIWRIYKRFYELCHERMTEDWCSFDEYDVFDEVIDHELILAERRKGNITQSDINNFDISIIHGTKVPKVKTEEKISKPMQLKLDI